MGEKWKDVSLHHRIIIVIIIWLKNWYELLVWWFSFWIGSKIIFLVQSLCLSHSHYQIDINVTITHSMELIHLWFMIITNQYQIIRKEKKVSFFTKLKWKQNWAISKTETKRKKEIEIQDRLLPSKCIRFTTKAKHSKVYDVQREIMTILIIYWTRKKFSFWYQNSTKVSSMAKNKKL